MAWAVPSSGPPSARCPATASLGTAVDSSAGVGNDTIGWSSMFTIANVAVAIPAPSTAAAMSGTASVRSRLRHVGDVLHESTSVALRLGSPGAVRVQMATSVERHALLGIVGATTNLAGRHPDDAGQRFGILGSRYEMQLERMVPPEAVAALCHLYAVGRDSDIQPEEHPAGLHHRGRDDLSQWTLPDARGDARGDWGIE